MGRKSHLSYTAILREKKEGNDFETLRKAIYFYIENYDSPGRILPGRIRHNLNENFVKPQISRGFSVSREKSENKMEDVITEEVLVKLSKTFSVPNIRPYQVKGLTTLIKGQDLFVSKPTGSGKSLVFQAAPFVFEFLYPEAAPKTILVISPLVSLITNQVNIMNARGIPACQLLKDTSTEETLKDIINGAFKVIYTSPEAVLENHRNLLKNKKFNDHLVAIAVDESHIIKKWGGSSDQSDAFRIWYSRIGEIRSFLTERKPIIALTATANKATFEFISESLSLDRPVVISEAPEKKNIFYALHHLTDRVPDLFMEPIVNDIIQNEYSAKRVLIFCRHMSDVRQVFKYANSRLGKDYKSYKTRPYAQYHANTEQDIKDFVVKSFESSDGNIRCLVATVAFGLGIDCKGLYSVIHFGPPVDLDDYFQESGRCGRDGKQSLALLFTYPACLSSCNFSDSIKNYCKNKEICRRNLLLREYGQLSKPFETLHLCCDICQRKCLCKNIADNNCGNNILNEVFYKLELEDANNLSSKNITLPSKTLQLKLKENLKELWTVTTKNVPNMHLSPDIAAGFPYQAINEIVCNALNFTPEVMKDETSILDKNLYPQIKEVIDMVLQEFGPGCQSPIEIPVIESKSESSGSEVEPYSQKYRCSDKFSSTGSETETDC